MSFPQAVVNLSPLLETIHWNLARMDLTWPCHDDDLCSVLVLGVAGEPNVLDAIRANMPELNEIQLGMSHVWPETKYVLLYCRTQLIDFVLQYG